MLIGLHLAEVITLDTSSYLNLNNNNLPRILNTQTRNNGLQGPSFSCHYLTIILPLSLMNPTG